MILDQECLTDIQKSKFDYLVQQNNREKYGEKVNYRNLESIFVQYGKIWDKLYYRKNDVVNSNEHLQL